MDGGGQDRARLRGRPGVWSALVAAAIVLLAFGLQVGLEGHDPLWLDESWTGAIVAQRGWRATAQQIYWDVNAPLYYVVIKLWSGVFGLSDLALRAPSLLFTAATPLAAALLPAPGLGRAQRLGWAAVLAFWFPTLCYAQEARCYALLLLVATLQTLAFMRLMQAPDMRRVAIWTALAATAILTHYDALYLGAAQGLIYLARFPRRAVASWPAALAFVPAFGWLAFHWPRIAEFARPGIAWYSPLTPGELPAIAAYLADGGPAIGWWLVALGLGARSLRRLPAQRRPTKAAPPLQPLLWAVAASALSAGALVAMGFLRPSFAFRYLTPCAPGLLLGLVALDAGLAGRRGATAAAALLGTVYVGVSGWLLGPQRLRMAPRLYNFEAASRVIARTRPSRLVFLWDHPVDPILHSEQLAGLGGFFLHREGLDIPVQPIVLHADDDPNDRLLQAARPPGSAILWLYDTVVRGTAAVDDPPEISERDPRWRCWRARSDRFGVLACTRSAGPAGSGAAAHQLRGASHPQGG